jgi:hypothetical protein
MRTVPRGVELRGLVSAAALAAAAVLIGGCGRSAEKSYDPDSAISIESGQIQVAVDSPFLKHLEVAVVGPAQVEGRQFRVVGQVVALANSSDELTGSKISWAELDPALSRSLGLTLPTDGSVGPGEAFGVADLPGEYAGQVARGDSVSVARYGLRKFEMSARVMAIRPASGDGDGIRVLFRLGSGEEWYPGNNCEVVFPMLRSHPVTIPTTALLHEGAQEYLLQQTGPGRFRPRSITILDTVDQSALVIGEVGPSSRIVSRGAILLKPYLHTDLRERAAAAQRSAQ